MKKAKVFWLHFNRFGHKKHDPDIWTIRTGKRNRHAKKVVCKVRLETIYRGDSAKQPRAYLKGVGVVTIKDRIATIQ